VDILNILHIISLYEDRELCLKEKKKKNRQGVLAIKSKKILRI